MDDTDAVRDLVSRTIRIETALSAQNIAQQTQMLAVCNLHAAMERLLTALAIAPQHPPVEAEPAVHSHRSGNRESSLEQQCLCSFVGCPGAQHKGCSAAKSVRHMQECSFCPDVNRRYLSIALHMKVFTKHPQVCVVDVCCWCCQMWEPQQNQDVRSRHRTACHKMAIIILQVTNSCL